MGLTLAALIAVLLAAGYYFGRETLRREIDAHLSSVASSRQDMVQAHLSQLKQRAVLLADHGEFRGLFHNLEIGQPDTRNGKYSQGRLDDLTDHSTILSASLADNEGHVLLADKGTEAGGDLAGDPAFVNGLAAPYVGAPRAVGDHFEVVLAAPIRDFAFPPKNIAVLMMIAEVSPLAAAVRDTTGLGQTGEVVLCIREGDKARTLFPPRGRTQNIAIPLKTDPAMAAALAGREFLGATRDYRGERVLASALPVGYGGWGLVTKMDTREAYAPIARALRSILVGGGIVATSGLVAAYLLARGIARPVHLLVQAASRVAGGDYEMRVPIKSADEFGVLSARFNEMTAAIRSRGAERDAKEAALRESELRLKTVGDHLPGSTIYEYGMRPDGSFYFVYLSAGIAHSTTYGPEELFAHPEKVYENVLEEDAARMMRATSESAQNLTVFDQQVRRRMPNGEIRWFHSRSMPRLLEDGNIVWDGVELDVTAYKQTEEALDRERALLRTLIDLLPDHIYVKDAQSRFLLGNIGVAQVMGAVRPENLIGKSDRDFYPPDESTMFRGDEEEVLAGRAMFNKEEPVTHPDGSQRFILTTKVPLKDAAGNIVGLVGIGRDITDRKRAEAEIHKLNTELEQRVIERTAQLEAANKELEAFSYSVSHDLRAPLRAVDGFAQAVMEDYGPLLPEEGQRYLQTIRGEAQKMGMLIDDLLTFSRLSRAPVHKQDINTGDMVRSVLDDLSSMQEGRQIDVRIGELPNCAGDPALLRQVWINLLSNALKYTQKREAAVVEVGCVQTEEGSAYFVRDDGTGFDMRYSDKLFRVFQRLHLAEEFEGTGVGLAIVQRIIHRHGGRVWAEAAPDRGATFHFTLGDETKL